MPAKSINNKYRKLKNLAFAPPLALGLFTALPASAQSQDELDALKRQIEELQQKLEGLESEVQKQTEAPPAPAPKKADKLVTSGNDKVSLEVSGQVNVGLLVTEDGERGDVFIVDNDSSSTRIRLVGNAKATEDFSVGTLIEVEFESNSTAAVNQNNEQDVGPNSFTERKLEFIFDHKKLGKLSVGQGDTASNNTSEVDLSGTAIVGYSSIADFAGGILFRDENGDLTNINIGSVFSNFDGLSREDRVRYDTPSLGGLKLAASLIADDRFDGSAFFNRKFGETSVAFGAAYADDPNDFEQINGSASIKFGSGLNATVASGLRINEDRDNGAFIYGKLGFQFASFESSTTSLAADYYFGEDIGFDGDTSQAFGVYFVQDIKSLATELYAGYRFFDLDSDNANLDPINGVLIGSRVKF